MLKAFQKYISANSLIDKTNKILLTISGGVDSMVMLHLFQKSGYHFEVAHCNFMLRGKDSIRDEKFVTSYCELNHIKCHTKRFNTTEFANENRLSIEEAARNLRYDWFHSLLTKHELDFIATAHHKNDVTETLIINMIRGTGLSGLHGIMPKRNFTIRPLLFCSKKDIERFATKHKIDFVFDSSNHSNIFTRNKIRNEIIPLLQSINPDVINSTNRLADYVKETELLLSYFLIHVRGLCISEEGNTIVIDTHKIFPQILNQTLIYELIKPYGFNSSQSQDVFNSIGKSGKIFYSTNYELLLNRHQIIINQRYDVTQIEFFTISKLPISIEINNKTFIFELINIENVSKDDLRNKTVQHISFDSLKLPLTIRKHEVGERFSPYGLKGSKKISDYLIDIKMSALNKRRLLALYDNRTNLVALLGIELDNKFAVTNSTKKTLRISQKQ